MNAALKTQGLDSEAVFGALGREKRWEEETFLTFLTDESSPLRKNRVDVICNNPPVYHTNDPMNTRLLQPFILIFSR